jgi:hypothetical protein
MSMEEESLMDAADRLYDQRRDDQREHEIEWKRSPENKCQFCGRPVYQGDPRFVEAQVCRDHEPW